MVAVFAATLLFAFCDLPFDLFLACSWLHFENGHCHFGLRHGVGKPREE
jgi:hypothetical protein